MKLKNYNASNLNTKKTLELVSFELKKLQCQFLNEKLYDVSGFEKSLFSKYHVFNQFGPLKRHFSIFSCLFLKLDFQNETLQGVSFRIKIYTCQILIRNFYNVPDFELKIYQRARFWIKIFYIIGSWYDHVLYCFLKLNSRLNLSSGDCI